MTSLFEPIAAGVAVALINKYIISKCDVFASCYSAFYERTHDDDTSSTTTSVVSETAHIHHF